LFWAGGVAASAGAVVVAAGDVVPAAGVVWAEAPEKAAARPATSINGNTRRILVPFNG
jgi:hypothetical protein